MFCDGELVKTHVRAQRGRRHTDWATTRPEKVAFLAKTPAWYRSRAVGAGPHVGQLVAERFPDPQATPSTTSAPPRACCAWPSYDARRLDAACQRALATGDPSYLTVKGILAAGLEATPLPAETTSGQAARVPALLRGPAALTDGMPAITTATPYPHGHHADGGAAGQHGDHDGQGVAG